MIEIEAHDEIELVGRATHERCIVDSERFKQRIREKLESAPSQTPAIIDA